MSKDFIPSREAKLVTWSVNFKTKITTAPTVYGLTAAQATQYGTKHDAFVALYQAANDPDTRSPSAIIAKSASKSDLIATARQFARIVQATPSVTPELKSELGLTVRDVEPTPVGPPTTAPLLTVVSASGRTVRMRLQDAASPTRRGRPEFTAGAAVFSFVGDVPPADLADWKFEGNTTRTTVDVAFPATVPNWSKVWLRARWFSPRLQDGPASAPVETALPGGISMAA